MATSACEPTLRDARAFKRPADPAHSRRPNGERCHEAGETRGGWCGRFRDFSQPPSLEDQGPNAVLGHDHSRQSSSRPKSLRRPPSDGSM